MRWLSGGVVRLRFPLRYRNGRARGSGISRGSAGWSISAGYDMHVTTRSFGAHRHSGEHPGALTRVCSGHIMTG